jgi:surface protein
MKQNITFLLCVLISMIGLPAIAHDIEVANADGKTIWYNFRNDNTELSVTYRGEWANSDYSTYTDRYTGHVVIPASVTYQGKTYPVTEVGNYAFGFCENLTAVTIPNSVTRLDNGAFCRCTGLTSVTIPNSVKEIRDNAFSQSGLTAITIPASVTNLVYDAFRGCSDLASITVDEGNTVYDSRGNCNAVIESETDQLIIGCKNTVIPSGVFSIGLYAFSGCDGLSSITIPNSVISLGGEVFSDCNDLTSIIIPTSVTSIGDWAMYGSSNLASVHLAGNDALTIGNYFLRGCSGLTDVYYYKEKLPTIGDNAFYNVNLQNVTLHVPAAAIDAFKAAEPWSGFKDVVALTEEEIQTIVATYDPNAPRPSIVYAVWCEGNTTLYFLKSEEKLEAGGTYDGQTITKVWKGKDVTASVNWNTPSWVIDVQNSLTNVVFDESFKVVKPMSCRGWFYRCEKLTTITGLSEGYLDTSEATTMRDMFYCCEGLTALDVSHFDTGKVTDMNSMFANCKILTTLDLSHFNTSQVTNMADMFLACDSLRLLDVSNFNTSQVTTMSGMFRSCEKLASLDVSSFDTRNVTNMYMMFANCESLTALDVSHFNTSLVTNMEDMFTNCKSLTTLDLSHFDTRNVTNMNGMFASCYQLTELDLSGFNTSKVTTMWQMFLNSQNLKSIYIGEGWDVSNVTNSSNMFYGCLSIEGEDYTTYNSTTTDKEMAHYGAGGYMRDIRNKALPRQNQKPYAVWCAGNKTLYFLTSETAIEAGATHDGQTVTNVWPGAAAFYDHLWNFDDNNGVHNDVTTVVIEESFQAYKPTTCYMWFINCKKLARIDGLSNLNTSRVTTMAAMFGGCESLTALDLRSFDTGKVVRFDDMFSGCTNLKAIYVGDGWDVNHDNIISSGMFYGCTSIVGQDGTTFDAEQTDKAKAHYGAGGYLRNGNDYTGIGLTPTISQGEGGWYDLSGRKLKQGSKAKGVYIVNGRKVVKN